MKRLTLLLLVASAVILADAQTSMRSLIIAMPDSVLPLLTQVNREDCVDFREAGMRACVTNRLGTTTELTELTSDYACWQYTASTIYEMKLLPLADSLQVLCMTHRLQDPVFDASLRFFDLQWNPLPSEQFIALPSSATTAALYSTTDYVLSPSSPTLTVTARQEYIDLETSDNADMAVHIQTRPTLFQWKDGRFVEESE